MDLNQQQQVVGATLRSGDSLLQVAAFAAPAGRRHLGRRARGHRHERLGAGRVAARGRGSLRTELAGTVVAAPPAQPGQPAPEPTRRPARFLGVDGPRWFLRGTISGPAASSPEAAAALEEAFRAVVVVRGTEPMPVREALPLTLPAEAAARIAAQQQAAGTPPAGGSTGDRPRPRQHYSGP